VIPSHSIIKTDDGVGIYACYSTPTLAFMNVISNVELQVVYWAERPPLWSSGQSFWLQIQRSRVRFPALPDFLSSSGSGTGSTQPREPPEVN
jgi:hypothetical protein